MKLSAAIHQSYMNRRSNSFRGSSGPLDSSTEAPFKSPAAIFWLALHAVCCLISLLLGFRFSRLVFLFFFSTSSLTLSSSPFRQLTSTTHIPLNVPSATVTSTQLSSSINRTASSTATTSSTYSRVVVGRHGIRIRPWPHPNPTEVMRAHQIIERVQREQRIQFGVKIPKSVIAITPTYVRTFQTLHLTGVMHTLMLVPYDVVWIVVEAGGVSNETASIISKSGVNKFFHIGFNRRMPSSWEGRSKLEAKMRLNALRVVREQKLDGVVMFVDDSNMHSMELFDEIQNVKWFGALSIGILLHSSVAIDGSSSLAMTDRKEVEKSPSMPVQGPACNASDKLAGWHTFNSLPYEGKSAISIDDKAVVLPQKLEWAGFVMNSRLLWKEVDDKPGWIRDLDSVDEDLESPLSLLKDSSFVEPLGSCGRQVLLWWLRVEARSDSKFPSGWIIDPPLEITVPSKRTPWPDTPPELPTTEKATTEKTVINLSDRPVKHTRSRLKRRSKRKHESKLTDPQDSARHSVQN